MLSFFTSTPNPVSYCFETSKNFESVRYFLTELRKKKIKLETDEARQDRASLTQQKYQVISCLIEEFDKEIEYFNHSVRNNQLADVPSEFELSNKLIAICLRILGSDYNLLVKPRNTDREMVDEGVKWGSAGIAVGAATVLPFTLAGACVVGGILISAQIARYLAGTNDTRANSAYLLIELTRNLLLLNQTLLSDALKKFALSSDFDGDKLSRRYQKIALTYHPEQKQEMEELDIAHSILLKHIEQKSRRQQEHSYEKQDRRRRY